MALTVEKFLNSCVYTPKPENIQYLTNETVSPYGIVNRGMGYHWLIAQNKTDKNKYCVVGIGGSSSWEQKISQRKFNKITNENTEWKSLEDCARKIMKSRGFEIHT